MRKPIHTARHLLWATSFNYIDLLKDKKAESIANALAKMFMLLGAPNDAIVTDNGREFINKALDLITKTHQVRHVRTTPYNPQGNSRTERRHREYNTYLRIATNAYGKSWDVGAYMANWCLNIRPRTGTNVCPFEALLGFKPRNPADGSMQQVGANTGKPFEGRELTKRNMSMEEMLKYLNQHRKWCMDIIERASRQVNETNLLRAEERAYEVCYNIGDLVLIARPRIGSRTDGTATRLMYQNMGPFEVVEKLSDSLYRVRKMGTGTVSTHHVKYLNPYLTKEAHEQKLTGEGGVGKFDKPKSNVTYASEAYMPKQGEYMLFMGVPRPGKPFFLVRVEEYDERTGDVTFQYLNNPHTKSTLVGHRLSWVRSMDQLDDEKLHMKQPLGYQPNLQYAHRDSFCWTRVKAKESGKMVTLTKKEVERALKYKG